MHCPRSQIEKPFHYSVCAYIYISSIQLLQLNLNCIYLFLMCFLLGPISKCPEELPVINAAYRIVMQSYIPDLLLAFKLLWRVCTDVLFKDYFFIYISEFSHKSVSSVMYAQERVWSKTTLFAQYICDLTTHTRWLKFTPQTLTSNLSLQLVSSLLAPAWTDPEAENIRSSSSMLSCTSIAPSVSHYVKV